MIKFKTEGGLLMTLFEMCRTLTLEATFTFVKQSVLMKLLRQWNLLFAVYSISHSCTQLRGGSAYRVISAIFNKSTWHAARVHHTLDLGITAVKSTESTESTQSTRGV